VQKHYYDRALIRVYIIYTMYTIYDVCKQIRKKQESKLILKLAIYLNKEQIRVAHIVHKQFVTD
jgi:hypothetical protein